MPIPESGSGITYAKLQTANGESFFEAVKPYYSHIYADKIKKEFQPDIQCHPDPDITNYFGEDNFRGSFGQVNQALAHLMNQGRGITCDDIFLFYGYYNEVKDGKLPKSSGKHVIFGYLQVGLVIQANAFSGDSRATLEQDYPFLKNQPHWRSDYAKNNLIFIARNKLSFAKDLPGWGVFQYDKELDLTQPNSTKLRDWCVPSLAGLSISGNGAGAKFNDDGSFAVKASYGQEFIIQESEKASTWAKNLIKNHTKK